VNFYHSYRGDTPDEFGFGKDIRIIRKTIEALDTFNSRGVPARGAWDIENYFSLEKIMPEYCPDIIESWKRRVADGKDEVQVMSYNNGLISAHTAAEFDDAIARAVTNAAGSGLRDLFGSFGPMVRPQEMMYTPIHIMMYPAHGITSMSLYYSAVPFNAFSNFVRPLPFEQRFNPLTLSYPGIEETMTLVPAYNHGDIADNISLRRWLKRLRCKQLAMPQPKDLLLLIDADADDEYWFGYHWPIVTRLLSSTRGIRGLIESVCDLDYVTFATPSEYVRTHPPVGKITIGQDTADGSFDGLSSWAEKWDNHQLWTGIERSRILELQTRHLLGIGKADAPHEEIRQLIKESYEARLKALSTTHFGMASPVMNLTRLKTGAYHVQTSVEKARSAVERAAEIAAAKSSGKPDSAEFTLFDYVRGVSTMAIRYDAKPSRALVRMPLSISETESANVRLLDSDGHACPFAIRCLAEEAPEARSELLFIASMSGSDQKSFRLDFSGSNAERLLIEKPALAKEGMLQNEFIRVGFDKSLQVTKLQCRGVEYAADVFLRSAVNYADRVAEARNWAPVESAVLGDGLIALERATAEIPLEGDGGKRVAITRELMLVSGLPYLYMDTRVTYPKTQSENYNKRRAQRLEQTYDSNWREVMPCEIRPALFGTTGRPLRVWKHNYCGHVSWYDLDYAEFSKNVNIDSFNNHITHAWVAVSDGVKGLLVAQTADVNCSLAFCPMRLRGTRDDNRVFLNPFGSYHGKQLRYVTAHTGLGRFISLKMADQLDPYAPSYNGREEHFSLLIAPYTGDRPPEEIRRDAEAFAYPYGIATDSKIIGAPRYRNWSFPQA